MFFRHLVIIYYQYWTNRNLDLLTNFVLDEMSNNHQCCYNPSCRGHDCVYQFQRHFTRQADVNFMVALDEKSGVHQSQQDTPSVDNEYLTTFFANPSNSSYRNISFWTKVVSNQHCHPQIHAAKVKQGSDLIGNILKPTFYLQLLIFPKLQGEIGDRAVINVFLM